MQELWVSVDRIVGTCTADMPMLPGKGYLVRNGQLHFPDGGPICVYALQSALPFFVGKEREFSESNDWLPRVHRVQCPDPAGRTIWNIERRPIGSTSVARGSAPHPKLGDLLIRVERVEGICTAGMAPGMMALLRGSSLYLPQPFCYYALQSLMPLLPAKQRRLEPDDWMATDNVVICPDPEGNVRMQIEKVGT